MVELTFLIGKSLVWLVIGLVLYCTLTLYKLFLLMQLQQEVVEGAVESNPVKGSLKRFPQFLTKTKGLFKLTFNYLFRYKTSDWPFFGNKYISEQLEFLADITLFLKPYLIFSVAFVVLRVWMESVLWIDVLKTTFGELQQVLFWLSDFAVIKFLIEYDYYLFALFGVLCIWVPYLSRREATTEKIRKAAVPLILYLSLIANISFFGANLGTAGNEKRGKLVQLQAAITALHDSIYCVAAEEVISRVIEQSTLQNENDHEAAKRRLDSFLNTLPSKEQDALLADSVSLAVTSFYEHLKNSYSLANLQTSATYINPDGEFVYQQPADDRLAGLRGGAQDVSADHNSPNIGREKKTKTPPSTFFTKAPDFPQTVNDPTIAYLSNKDVWNMARGEDLLKATKAAVKPQIRQSALEKKWRQTIVVFLGLGLDIGMDGLASRYPRIFENKFFQKIIEYCAFDMAKEYLTQRTLAFVAWAKGNNKSAIAPPSTAIIKVDTEIATAITSFIADKTEQIARQRVRQEWEREAIAQAEQERKQYEAANRALEKEISLRLRRLPPGIPDPANATTELDALIERSKGRYANNVDYLAGLYKYYNRQLSSTENIRRIQTREFKSSEADLDRSLRDYLIPGIGSMSNAEYNRQLRNNYQEVISSTSKLGLVKKLPQRMSETTFENYFPGFCYRCGLPVTFPYCPAGGLRIR